LIGSLAVLSDRANGSLALAQAGPGSAEVAPPVVSPPLNLAGSFAPADTLILYGDMAIFWGRGNPENCILKNRYKRGEPVGFRMTAIDPASGSFAETAEIVVMIPLGDVVEMLPMRYRGAGEGARPGFWTAKWVVPDNAPLGVIRYTVEARDSQGRTGVWAPYNLEASMLTITE
jgi:hypothetical protein